MRTSLIHVAWIAVLCLSIGTGCRVVAPAGPGPFHVYLTWQGDTATTMTVNAQTPTIYGDVVVHYDTVSRGGVPQRYAAKATGAAHGIDGLKDGRWIHAVELANLKPATDYYFVVGSQAGGFSPERRFRTLPDDDRPVRIVTGGDMGIGESVLPLLVQAAAAEPDAALIGGDIAYVNGELDNVGDWDVWLDRWETHMVTPTGRMVPMILAVGNHEVNGRSKRGNYGMEPVNAPFYYGFFAQEGQRSFFSRRLGGLASVIVLDTDHTSRFDGEQAAYLDAALAAAQEQPYRFALYHVPLYPAHRDFMHSRSAPGHEHWRPLFDKYRLTAAFENHDHSLKRTHPLRGDQVVPPGEGTIYIGDGCWGVEPRPVHPERPYLAYAEAVGHVWIVDITSAGVTYRAIGSDGEVVDRYPPLVVPVVAPSIDPQEAATP